MRVDVQRTVHRLEVQTATELGPKTSSIDAAGQRSLREEVGVPQNAVERDVNTFVDRVTGEQSRVVTEERVLVEAQRRCEGRIAAECTGARSNRLTKPRITSAVTARIGTAADRNHTGGGGFSLGLRLLNFAQQYDWTDFTGFGFVNSTAGETAHYFFAESCFGVSVDSLTDNGG